MLGSLCFMSKEIDSTFFYLINEELSKLKWYFYKFTGVNAEEAMQKTLIHTLTHYNPERGDLGAYIKKLAREISKENGKLVFVDFLEQTLSDDSDDEERKATIDTGRVSDFSLTVIDNIIKSTDRRGEVVNLALTFMDKFVTLCDALTRHDTNTTYYPKPFIDECLRISGRCSDFNGLCLSLYEELGSDLEWFLHLDDDNDGVWREADHLLINQHKSKRVQITGLNGVEVTDADIDKWVISGKLGVGKDKKRVISVYYYDVWEMMCNLIDDTETNEMKFIVDDIYIIRTLGGSLSVVNPPLYNEYDLVRLEILTNIIHDTGGRVLSVGSENIYLLCNSDYTISENRRVIRGKEIEFRYDDITDTVS